MSNCDKGKNNSMYNTIIGLSAYKPGQIYRPANETLYQQFLKPTDTDFGNYATRNQNGLYYDVNGCIARQSGMYCGYLKVPIPIYNNGKYAQFGTDNAGGKINLISTTNMKTCEKVNDNSLKDFNAVYIPSKVGGRRKHNRTKIGRKRRNTKRHCKTYRRSM